MARHRAWRTRWRIPARLYVVLSNGSYRRAAVGLALSLLARNSAGAAGSLGSAWCQREPAFRARHDSNGTGRAEATPRHLVARAPVPARHADGDPPVLLLSLHLDWLVGLDAAISRQ